MSAVLLGMAALLGILTAILLAGKGGFLIAGYNTASEEEKKKYDEKRLCRATGVYMGVLTILTAIWGFLGSKVPDWFIMVFVTAVFLGSVVLMLFANTMCRRNTGEGETKAGEQEAKVFKKGVGKGIFGGLSFSLVLTVFVGIMLFTGDVEISLEEEELYIDASYWPDYQISREDILKVSYEEDLDVGRRTGGLGSARLLEGNFRNKAYGDYLLYAYKKCKSYVILETKGKTVALNRETKEETKQLWEELKAYIEQGEGERG